MALSDDLIYHYHLNTDFEDQAGNGLHGAPSNLATIISTERKVGDGACKLNWRNPSGHIIVPGSVNIYSQ